MLTCVVGQPPVAATLEVGAVELCALLGPEVPHAIWAALQENMGVSVGTGEVKVLPYPSSVSWSPGVLASVPPTLVPGEASCSPSVPGRSKAGREDGVREEGWGSREGCTGCTSVWQVRWLRAGPTQLVPPSLLQSESIGKTPTSPTHLGTLLVSLRGALVGGQGWTRQSPRLLELGGALQ